MPTLTIQHEDGRVFNVAEQAFKDLYEPFGFKPTAVVYGGESHAYTEENLKAATVYEKGGFGPNDTPTTLETASRQAMAAGQTERANELAEQANTLRKVRATDGVTTNPPNTDLSAGPVAAENDPGRGIEAAAIADITVNESTPDTGKTAAKASAKATETKDK